MGVLDMFVETELVEDVDEALEWLWWWLVWCMERIEDTDEEVDLRPRRPAEDRRIVDRGVMGDGDSECRLYEPLVGARRWLCELRPGVEKPAAVGLSRLPDAFVRMVFEGMPLTTRFVGMVETAVTGGVCEVMVLPVCGLGLFSLESFPSLPPRALSRRLGVE